jgi:hypothetical protein
MLTETHPMKNLTSYFFPALLIILGGVLLIVGAMQGQNSWVMLGSGLALMTASGPGARPRANRPSPLCEPANTDPNPG